MIRARGVSLIELMITLALGAIVLGTVLRAFVTSQDTYRVQEDAARVQENLRFALGEIAKAVREAAFYGGARSSDVAVEVATTTTDAPCSPAWSATPSNALRGFEGANRSPAPICTVSRYIPQSDLLVATFANPDAMPRPSEYVASDVAFGPGNLFLRAQVGGKGAIFEGAAGRPAALLRVPGTDTDGIHEYRLRTMAYSLGLFDSGSQASAPTLYVCDSATRCGTRTNPQPLVEGIEQLQVDFGVDADGDHTAEQFIPSAALTVENWSQIVAVRIGLVACGERIEPFAEARDYPLPGGFRYRPSDDPRTAVDEQRLVRRALVQTIQVRNRTRS
jgi:type IV pilus assembly protein PilW